MIAGVTAGEFYALAPWQVLAYIQGFSMRQKANNIRFANLAMIIATIFSKDSRHSMKAQNCIMDMYGIGKAKKKWKPKTIEETRAFIEHAKKAFGDA